MHSARDASQIHTIIPLEYLQILVLGDWSGKKSLSLSILTIVYFA